MKYPLSWIKSLSRFCNLLGPVDDFIAEYSYDFGDKAILPSLCNGYIGLDPSEPWVFLDGVFCGEGLTSHRAAIPSPVNWLPIVENEVCHSNTVLFHFGMGVIVNIQFYDGFEIFTSTFVSRARPHLLVRSVTAVFRNEGPYDVHFKPDKAIDWSSPDFKSNIEEIDELLHYSGSVYTMENSELLPFEDRVFVVSNFQSTFNKQGAVLTRNRPSITYLTTFSRLSKADALEAFDRAVLIQTSASSDALLEENAEAWLNRWSQGRITLVTRSSASASECDDNMERRVSKDGKDFHLSRCLISAQYTLLSNFPEYLPDNLTIPSLDGPEHSKVCSFFGLCPSGLGRGNSEDDYMGHVFWDMDIWMLPWMNLMHPALALMALKYRYATLHNAELRAKREGYRGARFAWESARTGLETCPWDLSANLEIHVVADVSIAIQNWLRLNVTPNGRMWYENEGQAVLNAIAAFWESRVEFSSEKKAYVIQRVMPPDEYCSSCDNSAYTNAAASWALSGPAVIARLFGCKPSVQQEVWEKISKNIWMPLDEKSGVMLEYEGYKDGTVVKQADTILLNYPLLYKQSREATIRMLNKYAPVTSDCGPAMTWAMFFISALEVGLLENALLYFDRSLLYCKPPFYVWTENLDEKGAMNFVTGVGGFLQAITNGLLGIRIITQNTKNGQTESVLCITPKMVGRFATGASSFGDNSICSILQVYGLAFAGRRLDIAVNGVMQKIKITLAYGDPLVLVEGDQRIHKGMLRTSAELPLDSTFKLTAPQSD